MSLRPAVVRTIARAHLTVWRADLRQTLGGAGRVRAAAVAAVLAILGTAVLSWGIAPDFSDPATRERATRAVVVVVLVVGALVWTAMSLALPDSSSVDTVLTAVPADARERRVGLAMVAVVPALTLTLVVALAVCGGLVRDVQGMLRSVSAAGIVLGAAVAGLGVGALLAGGLTAALRFGGLLGTATSRGLAAATTVGIFGYGLFDVMGDVDAAPSVRNPLRFAGVLGAAGLRHPALSLAVTAAVLVLGTLAVAVGASLGRSAGESRVRSPFRGVSPAGRRVPSWIALQCRQLRRYQPNVGLLVLVVAGSVGAIVLAGSRSGVFAHSAFFGLSSLLTTSAITIAGVEGRADWLYHHLGRWQAHVLTRLAAYVLCWLGFISGLALLLTWRSSEFTVTDALGILPLLVLELGLVALLGALVPVSDEHGLSAISGEFGAILAVLLVAIGLPRIPGLTDAPGAMTVAGVGGGLVALAVHVIVQGARVPTSRTVSVSGHAA